MFTLKVSKSKGINWLINQWSFRHHILVHFSSFEQQERTTLGSEMTSTPLTTPSLVNGERYLCADVMCLSIHFNATAPEQTMSLNRYREVRPT